MRPTSTGIPFLLRPILLVCLLPWWLGCSGKGSEISDAGSDRPSILLLVADDLGRSFVGAYGNADAPTPSLDRLAAEGMRFDAAFTPTALCRPSRWALYTGLYPHASGVTGFTKVPRDVSLVHEVLRNNGYFTGLLGKFGSLVQSYKPFEHFVGSGKTDEGKDLSVITEAAAEFFRSAGDRPFFLIVGFGDPHVPYPSEPYLSPGEVGVPGYLPDLPEVRESLAHYYAAIERLDGGVEQILEQLALAGRDDDTLVLFISDHGPAFAFAKSSLYDAGVRIPMIARWPGVTPAGSSSEAMVSLVDFRATILDVVDLADPVVTQGRSLLPLLKGAPPDGYDEVFLSHTSNFVSTYPMRGLRTERYKYVRNFEPEAEFVSLLEGQAAWRAILVEGQRDPELAERIAQYSWRPAEELYDLRADPAELHNLAAKSAMAPALRRLRERLHEKMVEVGDPLAELVLTP